MMLRSRKWMGIRLNSRFRRRTLVCGYYLFMMLLEAAFCWRLFKGYDTRFPGRLLPSILLAFTFLGGFGRSGPVKPFSERFHSRNLWPITLFSRKDPASEDPDESDKLIRDRVHYLAYAAIQVIAVILAIGFCLVADVHRQWLPAFLLLTGYPFLVLLMTMPQAMILWIAKDVVRMNETKGLTVKGTAL